MEYIYSRRYCGNIKAVILDWAGTTMDFGCMAPAVVFVEIFKQAGVPITMEEARIPMGAHKRVHIKQITQLEAIHTRWKKVHGKSPTDADVDELFKNFIPIQLDCLSTYSKLIPGTLEILEQCKQRDYKIGSTSGYLKDMMAINLADAKKQGYIPDSTVCADDVPQGRPFPYMCLKNVIDLGVSPIQACVKVDDTVPGVEEGLNAGMWTVGLAVSGNEVGLSLEDYQQLAPAIKKSKRYTAYQRMTKGGAHYVIDTIADLMPCLDDIEARIKRGENP